VLNLHTIQAQNCIHTSSIKHGRTVSHFSACRLHNDIELYGNKDPMLLPANLREVFKNGWVGVSIMTNSIVSQNTTYTACCRHRHISAVLSMIRCYSSFTRKGAPGLFRSGHIWVLQAQHLILGAGHHSNSLIYHILGHIQLLQQQWT
jgi:hypothetical protein